VFFEVRCPLPLVPLVGHGLSVGAFCCGVNPRVCPLMDRVSTRSIGMVIGPFSPWKGFSSGESIYRAAPGAHRHDPLEHGLRAGGMGGIVSRASFPGLSLFRGSSQERPCSTVSMSVPVLG